MLDGLLGRGFSAKCKPLIKVTKTRIDVIRRKRNATQKFLKKDIADLLANGLDINAYGRADGLIAELILSSCYDFVEHACDCILTHLSMMQKQSECPEECKVAIASLMFAAARFSDLPELRDIRNIFQERYGNSLEYSVNQKFVENLSSNPSTLEKKVQLMQAIAVEFSIKWNSKPFEQRMSKTPVSAVDKSKKYGSAHATDDRFRSPNGNYMVPEKDKKYVFLKENHGLPTDGHRSNRREDNLSKKDNADNQLLRKQDFSSNGHKPVSDREEPSMKGYEHNLPFQHEKEDFLHKLESHHRVEDAAPKTYRLGSSSHGRRHELIDAKDKLHTKRDNAEPKKEIRCALSNGRHELLPSSGGLLAKTSEKDMPVASNNHDEQGNIPISVRKIQGEESNGAKSYNRLVPPPYTKPPKASKPGSSSRTKHANYDLNGTNGSSADALDHNGVDSHDRWKGRASPGTRLPPLWGNGEGQIRSDRSEDRDIKSDNLEYKEHAVRPERARSHDCEKDHHHRHHNDVTGEPMPKPRSVRRRHSKSSSSHEDTVDSDDRRVAKRSSSSRRRGESRRGLQQVLFDDDPYRKDEEEKIIDKLLMHYSTKPSNFDPEKLIRKPKGEPSHQTIMEAGGSTQSRSRDKPDERLDMVPPPRSISLPCEPSASSEQTKVFIRAASFQPDRPAQHVHPKLPDYDDLAARFAALKGR